MQVRSESHVPITQRAASSIRLRQDLTYSHLEARSTAAVLFGKLQLFAAVGFERRKEGMPPSGTGSYHLIQRAQLSVKLRLDDLIVSFQQAVAADLCGQRSLARLCCGHVYAAAVRSFSHATKHS